MNQSPNAPNAHTLTVAPGTFCISCRYDLMGLPAEANCPQCSRTIRDSLRFSPGSSGLPIAFDAWCTACGYNLVGLPDTGRRRTPGLRREEVAMLAGISAEYYLRLEQGRDRNPSTQVLEAEALDAAENNSPYRSPASVAKSRPWRRMSARTFRWVWITPFGRPVDPEV
mgnify:CR=1 FL=1